MSRATRLVSAALSGLAITATLLSSTPAAAGQAARPRRVLGARVVRADSPGRLEQVARLRAIGERAARLAAASRPREIANSPAPPALDAWVGNGAPVCTGSLAQIFPSIVADGSGGAVIGWLDFRIATGFGRPTIRANRLDGNGDFPAGWTSNGLAVMVRDSFTIDAQIASDGSGGAFFGITEFWLTNNHNQDVIVQRVLSSGVIGAGWPAKGKPLNLGPNDGFLIRSDAAGGAFVGWVDTLGQGRVVRIDGNGNNVSGWPATGIPVAYATTLDSDFTPDGAGGFYGVWSSNDSVLCTRYAANGTLSPGWSADGNVLAAGVFFTDGVGVARLTSGDAMVSWLDYRFFDTDLFAIRVGAGGSIPSPWTVNGVPVCTATGSLDVAKIVADNAGGAVMIWEDYRDLNGNTLFAQRVTSAGAIATGWTVDGVALCQARPNKTATTYTSDGAGGILGGWSDDLATANDYDIYVQRIMADGTRPALFPADGISICSATFDQVSPVMATDAASGAIVAWEDQRNSLTGGEIYAARVLATGVVSAQAALVDASAEPGAIRLHWFSPDGARFSATLERDADGAGFVSLATLRADGAGHLRYEDRAVAAGSTYRYRLVVEEGASRLVLGEATLRVPESAALALEPARPNPTGGPLTLSFVLPSAAPARIELLDITGRRVFAREAGAAGAGRHLLRIEDRLAPGLYVVRLSQAGRVATTRVVVTE